MASGTRRRRTIPAGLLVLLVGGTGLAAWAGLAAAPAGHPFTVVEQAEAATVRAGTADVHVSSVSVGNGTIFDSSSAGFGQVEFPAVSSQLYVVSHQVGTESSNGGPSHQVDQTLISRFIHTRSGTFQQLAPSPAPPGALWMKLGFPASTGPFAALQTEYLAGMLASLAHFAAIPPSRVTGLPVIGGVSTTEYQWVPAVLTCSGTSLGTVRSADSYRVWIDAAGRIRQMQQTIRLVTRMTGQAIGRLSTVDTLTFTSFGARVTITTPPLMPNGDYTEGSATARPNRNCHSS
jgi:hypothetical protein